MGFVANNSAVASGQTDIDAALKNARFIRFATLQHSSDVPEMAISFCREENRSTAALFKRGAMPMQLLTSERHVLTLSETPLAARASLTTTPRVPTVVALPTTRVAVMGPAGVEYVYKDELKAIRGSVSERVAATKAELVSQGVSADDAQVQAEASIAEWAKAAEADLCV